jgi:predicted permease
LTNLLAFFAVILVAALFISIVIVGRIAYHADRERQGWVAAFMHLHENPGDLPGAYRAAKAHMSKETFLEAAASLLERFKRDRVR